MKEIEEIEEACNRATKNQKYSREQGSRFRGMTYEDGVRDALDWVCENIEEDPTNE